MESASLFNISQNCFQCILTNNIYIDDSVLWFTKATVCCTDNSPASVLLMFVIVSTFPSRTTTVFPLFPGVSLIQVMFGSTPLDASQINCKLSPSRTVDSAFILLIFVGTRKNQTITSKLQG